MAGLIVIFLPDLQAPRVDHSSLTCMVPFSTALRAEVSQAIAELKRNPQAPTLAAKHSWDLWKWLNNRNNFSVSLSIPSLARPRWLAWCTADESFTSLPPENCVSNSKYLSTGATFNLEKLVLGPKFRVPVHVGAFQAESVHVNPELVSALNCLLNPNRRSIKGQKLLKSAIGELKERKVREILGSDSLPPDSMVVKASWLYVTPRKEATVVGIGDWAGGHSWKNPSQPWGDHFRWKNKVKLTIPPKSSVCSGSVESALTPRPGEVSLSEFFFLQVCDPLHLPVISSRKHAKVGDLIILTGLHVMTNLNPEADWTWSTFYWQPSKHSDRLGLSAMAKFIKNARPKDLDGWRTNYRMEFQYSRDQVIPPDDTVKNAIESRRLKHLTVGCSLAPVEPRSPVIFNPFVEGRFECGGYSNCLSCHSHARTFLDGTDPLSGTVNPGNRRYRNGRSPDDSAIYTHFLWSLARR